MIQSIHYFTHTMNDLQAILVCFIHRGMVKDYQNASTLVKNSCEGKINFRLQALNSIHIWRKNRYLSHS